MCSCIQKQKIKYANKKLFVPLAAIKERKNTIVQKRFLYKILLSQRYMEILVFVSKKHIHLKNNPQFQIVVVNFVLIYLFFFIFSGCQNRFWATYSQYFTRHELAFQHKIYRQRVMEFRFLVVPVFFKMDLRAI